LWVSTSSTDRTPLVEPVETRNVASTSSTDRTPLDQLVETGIVGLDKRDRPKVSVELDQRNLRWLSLSKPPFSAADVPT